MEMARSGLGLNPRDAIDHIAKLVAQQDPTDDLYAVNVEGLLRLCACIWSLRRDTVAPGWRSQVRELKGAGPHPEAMSGSSSSPASGIRCSVSST
ncbi:hypothetical protein J2W30_006339 [Variovorax boronicumulans]|nr:hypothetical protein [Variovorax boronicumulans]MDQ0005817.1 hypothetical protein [Variovorax boronicumulans]MDQ0038552.1 hypothetical protein [Variovorax boronicumulans]MDQ0045701.1 hypothetical protein [Variovorax boronicumulans]